MELHQLTAALNSSLSRLLHHYQNSNFGVITAFRGEYHQQENRLRNSKLVQDLLRAGYELQPVHGGYVEQGESGNRHVLEESLLVLGHGDDQTLHDILVHLVVEYDQESALFKPLVAFGCLAAGQAGLLFASGSIEPLGALQLDADGPCFTKLLDQWGEPDAQFRFAG